MMAVPREVKGGSLGAFRRFEGSLGVFCCHAAMVLDVLGLRQWCLDDALLRTEGKVQKCFFCFLGSPSLLMLDC